MTPDAKYNINWVHVTDAQFDAALKRARAWVDKHIDRVAATTPPTAARLGTEGPMTHDEMRKAVRTAKVTILSDDEYEFDGIGTWGMCPGLLEMCRCGDEACPYYQQMVHEVAAIRAALEAMPPGDGWTWRGTEDFTMAGWFQRDIARSVVDIVNIWHMRDRPPGGLPLHGRVLWDHSLHLTPAYAPETPITNVEEYEDVDER